MTVGQQTMQLIPNVNRMDRCQWRSFFFGAGLFTLLLVVPYASIMYSFVVAVHAFRSFSCPPASFFFSLDFSLMRSFGIFHSVLLLASTGPLPGNFLCKTWEVLYIVYNYPNKRQF